MSTCAEANAPCTLMSVTTGPRHRETLVGYLCPACADSVMKQWAEASDERPRLAVVPRPRWSRPGYMNGVLGGETQRREEAAALD